MLFEFQVVKAVATFLKNHGYEVHQALAESEKGDDIIATSPDKNFRLFVEAKGESSSKSWTSRYGKLFTYRQVKVHVGVALYRAAQMLENPCELPVRVALAFPANDDHRRAVSRIKKALTTLGVEIFWVSPDGTVSLEGLSSGLLARGA